MELGTTIIGVIFLVLAFSPVFLMSIRRKKKEKALLQTLAQVANRQNCKVSKQEYFGEFAIGIDESNDAVFYVKKTNDTLIEEFVYLAAVQECRVLNISNSSNSFKRIDKLDLSFMPREKNKAEIKLTFYSADSNTQIFEELKSIENWSRIIKDHLKKMTSGQK